MSCIVACENIGKTFVLYDRPLDRLLESVRLLFRRKPRTDSRLRVFTALKSVSFQMARGETLAVIGRNGSGKSTLLQIIVGTLNSSSGKVLLNGRVSALLELGAGFNPEFTGVENVRLNATLLGMSSPQLAERMPAILAFADIGEHAHLPVKTYSSGMFVRLAFSVMAHCDTELLIVDEALSVGDAAFQSKCMLWLRDFQRRGGSLLFVSHDIAAVRALCQRAIYLDHGVVKDVGLVGPVTDHYLRDIHLLQNEQCTAVANADEDGNVGMEVPVYVPLNVDAAKVQAFEARWIPVRQGTGEARIRFVELLNEAGQAQDVFYFDAPMRVRIHVECIQACRVSVNYKIRDRQLQSVLGADFLIAGAEPLSMQSGQIYLVEYASHLALMAGDYSLRLSVTVPLERHRQAVFVDIVEVALMFKVLPAEAGWIYTQAYLPNTLHVSRGDTLKGILDAGC